ncbi:RNA-directed DNA polymerase from mobile element jockey [Plakobranchus ocellatus]|uniref:RNA-directed DNA polymerase from mobile element jockey n=1 Tax=Plakobranchus ocellatus TaxID=259542 RepID=A0AAV4B4M4_9GAST|nr:RNA-directed DNA polymerase from mobile element jockey [Plakobranchus ocellatus]
MSLHKSLCLMAASVSDTFPVEIMYGCEAWTISKQIQNKLEATEMWFLRRMLRIPWTAKKTNERVLNEANKRRSLVRTISYLSGPRDEKRKTGTFGNSRKV